MQKRISRAPSTIYHLPSTNHGFTIIELLVVIVIIGILVAISIVTYGGVQNRAIATSLQSDLTNASDQLVIDQAHSSTGVFPATMAAANSGAGISTLFSTGTTPTYTVNNTNTPKTFCLTATKSSQNYFITQEGIPLPGPCPVLYLDAGIPTSYPGTGSTWTDLSGNGNNGTLVNGVGYSSANGGSLIFDSVDDYVSEYSIPDSFWNSGSWTVSTWVSFNTVNKGSDNAIIGHGSIGTNNGLHLCERSTRVYFGFYGNDMASNTTLSAGTWYNLIFTFNNSSKLKQIYINGAFDNSSGAVGYGGAGSNTEIGRYPWATTNLMYGKIAGTRLYNSVLPTSEIQQNFNNLKSRYGI